MTVIFRTIRAMGLDFNALHLLDYARKRQELKRTLMLGRQHVDMNPPALRRLCRALGIPLVTSESDYAEPLLQRGLGATSVDSLDASAYEGATIQHDLNAPIQPPLEPYDTILDFGTLEHVFDVPQALANVTALCRTGGQILHVVPATNFLGHGFYQFSPELFFSYYSEDRGFQDTEVFLADTTPRSWWYRAHRPTRGERHELLTNTQFSLCVRTVRSGRPAAPTRVQQSDYLFEWEGQETPRATRPDAKTRLKKVLRSTPWLYDRAKRLGGIATRLIRKFSWKELHYVHARPSRLERIRLQDLK